MVGGPCQGIVGKRVRNTVQNKGRGGHRSADNGGVPVQMCERGNTLNRTKRVGFKERRIEVG